MVFCCFSILPLTYACIVSTHTRVYVLKIGTPPVYCVLTPFSYVLRIQVTIPLVLFIMVLYICTLF